MSSPSLAMRRHQRDRYLSKTISQVKHRWWWDDYSAHEIRLRSLKLTKNRAICSCSMCGNVRHNGWISKWEQLSRQEQRAQVDFEQQLVDIYDGVCDNDANGDK